MLALQSCFSSDSFLFYKSVNCQEVFKFFVRELNDKIKTDFIHTKRTTFPTKMKINIRLEELK